MLTVTENEKDQLSEVQAFIRAIKFISWDNVPDILKMNATSSEMKAESFTCRSLCTTMQHDSRSTAVKKAFSNRCLFVDASK